MRVPQIVTVCLILSPVAQARVDTTPAMAMCRNLEVIIWSEFLSQGKELPATWSEIETIQEMIKNHTRIGAGEFRLFNSLAIAPGSPIIREESGISRDHSNCKLFAIGRTWNFDYSNNRHSQNPDDGGRFVILVSPDNTKIAPYWIAEPEVQVILKQLNGFDPAKEPVAFDHVEEYERDQKESKDKISRESNLAYNNSIRPKKDRMLVDANESGGRRSYHSWILWTGGALLAGILIWLLRGLLASRIDSR